MSPGGIAAITPRAGNWGFGESLLVLVLFW